SAGVQGHQYRRTHTGGNLDCRFWQTQVSGFDSCVGCHYHPKSMLFSPISKRNVICLQFQAWKSFENGNRAGYRVRIRESGWTAPWRVSKFCRSQSQLPASLRCGIESTEILPTDCSPLQPSEMESNFGTPTQPCSD